MAREYVTRAFQPVLKEKHATGDEIAKYLQDEITIAAKSGWLFQSYETVQITINPGCLAMFSGPRLSSYPVLVFYRDVP